MSIKRNPPEVALRSIAGATAVAMLLTLGMTQPSIAQSTDGQSIKEKLRSTLPP